MTLHDRVMAVFRRETPDRLPWFSDLSYWVRGQRQQGLLPDKHRHREGYLKLHQDLGCGIFAFAPPVHRSSWDEDLFRISNRQEGDLHFQDIETPEGTLNTVQAYSGLTFSMAPQKYAVATPADLRSLRCFYQGERVEPALGPYSELKTLWGDQGLAVLWAPRSPLGQLAVTWTGVQNLSYLVADCPDEVEETLSVIDKAQDPVYDIIVESPAEAIEIGDNLSGETMGGLFRRFSSPIYRRRTAQLHDAGKYLGVHLDGTTRGLIAEVAGTGLDYIEAITPKPVGDVEVEDVFCRVADDTIIWGGVPGAMFCPPYTWDDVKNLIDRIYALPEAQNRFVLCSADQVPVNGDIDLVRRIADYVEEKTL